MSLKLRENGAVDDKERLRLWLKLLGVTRSVEAKLRENLRIEFATTLPRFDVMAALYRYGEGLKMSQLSGLLRVSNGNVTCIVDKLVAEGLAIRVAVPGDRRAWHVRLTKKGTEKFKVQAEEHERWINDLLGVLSEEDAMNLSFTFDEILQDVRNET